VRFFGAIASRPEAVHKLIDKLAMQHPRPTFCYGAGPTVYGLYRQIRAIGYECRVVVAPMVPVRPGGHIKTDRRDATTLAALSRAGELTAILSVGLASRLRCSDQPGPQRKLAASHVHVRFLSIRLYIAPRFIGGSRHGTSIQIFHTATAPMTGSGRTATAPRLCFWVDLRTEGGKTGVTRSPWIGRRGGKLPFSVVAPVAATQKAPVSWATSLACEASWRCNERAGQSSRATSLTA
jgi:hypothetical protein